MQFGGTSSWPARISLKALSNWVTWDISRIGESSVATRSLGLQILIIPIYTSLPIHSTRPCRVRLPVQLRDRPTDRGSSRRIRCPVGLWGCCCVRDASRGRARCGTRMRFMPRIRIRSRRAGGDSAHVGRVVRSGAGLNRTRHPFVRTVRPAIQTRCRPEQRRPFVPGRVTWTSRSTVTLPRRSADARIEPA